MLRKSKIRIYLLLTMLSIIILGFACSNPVITTKTDLEKKSLNEDAVLLPLNSNPIIQSANFIAQNRLDEVVTRQKGEWTEKSRILGCYPIYLPGSDSTPDYYEFKVKTEEKDSGYILVNVTKSDIQIPEISTEGKTLTELYKDATKEENIKVIRFDWFKSAAESKEISRSGDIKLLATMGFNGNGMKLVNETRSGNTLLIEDYCKFKESYSISIKNDGCLPIYNKGAMELYYNKIENYKKRGTAPAIVYESDILDNKFYKTNSDASLRDGNWHVPAYWQDYRDEGFYVGCAPLAWTMIYAYWARFKSKYLLFWDKKEDITKTISNTDFTNFFINSSMKYYNNSQWTADIAYLKSIFYFNGVLYVANITNFSETQLNNLDAIYKRHNYAKALVERYLENSSSKTTGEKGYKIWRATVEIGNDLGVYKDWATDGGVTDPYVIDKYGKNYALRRGYTSCQTYRHTLAWDWTGGTNFIWDEITADRPVSLWFYADYKGTEGGHQGVICGIEKRYWNNTGVPTELGLLVNYGWGSDKAPRWIYAFTDTWKTYSGDPPLRNCFEVYKMVF